MCPFVFYQLCNELFAKPETFSKSQICHCMFEAFFSKVFDPKRQGITHKIALGHTQQPINVMPHHYKYRLRGWGIEGN